MDILTLMKNLLVNYFFTLKYHLLGFRLKSKSLSPLRAEFKAKVCLESIKERSTTEMISKKFMLNPTQINLYKQSTYYF